MNEWEPIETAPKDGTLILAYNGKNPYIAFYGRVNSTEQLGWLGGHCRICHIDIPTYWIPLPKSPEAENQ